MKFRIKDSIIEVDAEDYERLSKFRWYASFTKQSFYRKIETDNGIYYRNIQNEIFQTNGVLYDHVNRNRLDNRKRNLRTASVSQNAMNRNKVKGCSSIYKGVSFSKYYRKWEAYITVKGKRIKLGLFDDEVVAAKEYNKHAMILHKEFALLNCV